MSTWNWVALGIALGSLLAILSVFTLYPLLLWLLPRRAKRSIDESFPEYPTVTLIVVARNASLLIPSKIQNLRSLDYPHDKLTMQFVSDGSEDDSGDLLKKAAAEDPRIQVTLFEEHRGKTEGLNHAAASSEGEILIFSDADAILENSAARRAVQHFRDRRIGGVCGARIIGVENHALKSAQSRYISADTRTKRLESQSGSITSNDGKLYAIRKTLFRPIPEAVTDDLFTCLNVVYQHYRFIFDGELRATITVPSRNAEHEILRRRRIVSRSLRGIIHMRGVLNPFVYGLFSLGLIINKIVRRLMPVFLFTLAVSTSILALSHSLVFPSVALSARLLCAGQALFYTAGILYPLTRGRLGKVSSVAYFFCVGNWAMFLGVLDYLLGKRTLKWDPLKNDQ